MVTKEQIDTLFGEIEARINGIPKETKFEVVASIGEVKASQVPQPTLEDISYLHERISSAREYMYSMYRELCEMMAEHKEGHLPKIKGAGAMNKALKSLGLDSDYKAEIKTIYASTGKPEKLVVEIPIKD